MLAPLLWWYPTIGVQTSAFCSEVTGLLHLPSKSMRQWNSSCCICCYASLALQSGRAPSYPGESVWQMFVQPVYPTVTFLAPASAPRLRLWHLFIYLFIFQPKASLYLHQDGTAQTPERSAAPHTSLHPSIPPELRQQPFILTIATSKFTLVTYC